MERARIIQALLGVVLVFTLGCEHVRNSVQMGGDPSVGQLSLHRVTRLPDGSPDEIEFTPLAVVRSIPPDRTWYTISLIDSSIGDTLDITSEDFQRFSEIGPINSLSMVGVHVQDSYWEPLRSLSPKRLNLAVSNFSAENGGTLSSLQRLEYVDLTGLSLGDETFRYLSRLPNLKTVIANGTNITPSGLADLVSFGQVEFVEVVGTSIDREVVQGLKKEVGNTTIVTSKPLRAAIL